MGIENIRTQASTPGSRFIQNKQIRTARILMKWTKIKQYKPVKWRINHNSRDRKWTIATPKVLLKVEIARF